MLWENLWVAESEIRLQITQEHLVKKKKKTPAACVIHRLDCSVVIQAGKRCHMWTPSPLFHLRCKNAASMTTGQAYRRAEVPACPCEISSLAVKAPKRRAACSDSSEWEVSSRCLMMSSVKWRLSVMWAPFLFFLCGGKRKNVMGMFLLGHLMGWSVVALAHVRVWHGSRCILLLFWMFELTWILKSGP